MHKKQVVMDNKFDDIRPYNQDEFLEALQRISNHPNLVYINAFIYPGTPVELLQQKLRSIRSVYDFQRGVMYDAIKRIVEMTTSSFTRSGFEKLDKNKPYLFISNHRDIMLDPAFLDFALFCEGMQTVEISFGDNLMMNQLFADIGRSNKMFKVIRSCSMREMLENSKHLSEYIRDAVTNRRSSVWISQRNGRTKDGIDSTDQGLLKMLSLSKPKEKSYVEAFSELNIVPMSISYEKEPCDIMKAREILIKNTEGVYVKKEGEDARSIMAGMSQPKGRVHMAIADPITADELEEFADQHANIFNNSFAELINRRIRSNYHLMPSNFIAHDILFKQDRFADRYTENERRAFESHVELQVGSQTDLDPTALREILLGIYANCVDSYINSL